MRLIDICNHKFFRVKADYRRPLQEITGDAFTLTNLNNIKFSRYHIDGIDNIINVQTLNKTRIRFPQYT